MSIHPHALVSSSAHLGCDVSIGPFSIIEDEVFLGDGTTIESGVVVKRGSRIGKNNRVFEGCVIGGEPQHARPPQESGAVEIGDNNTLRENITIHRALHAGGTTSIGNNNLLMVGVHIAHDCSVGSNTIFANNVLLAGHVTVGDRAYLSGASAVHQFCRIGSLAMVGGHARVVQDVPPYVTVDGATGLIVGLNLVGLRRNGFTAEEIIELKNAYRVIYRSGMTWNEVLGELRRRFTDGSAARFHEFLSQGTRGFVQERRMPPSATIKLRAKDEETTESEASTSAASEPMVLRAKAG